MLVAYRLQLQTAVLRSENARFVEQNEDLRRALAGSDSATVREEEPRKLGYARPDERVYVLTSPSPMPPAPSVPPAAATGPTWWDRVRDWWRASR